MADPRPSAAEPVQAERFRRIRIVLERFAARVVLAIVWSMLVGLVGGDFWSTIAAMMLGMAFLCLMFAVVLEEPFMAPHFTHYDESAWFLLIALAVKQAVRLQA